MSLIGFICRYADFISVCMKLSGVLLLKKLGEIVGGKLVRGILKHCFLGLAKGL